MGLFRKNSFSTKALTRDSVQDFGKSFPAFARQFESKATDADKGHNLDAQLQNFKKLWGIELPGELRQLFQDLKKLGYPHFSNWESSPLRADIVNQTGNILESVLLTAQVEFPTDHHMDWFTGSVSLDPVVNDTNSRYRHSFSIQYPIYEASIIGKESPQIYLYQHNNPDVWGTNFEVMAKDTSSFLYIIMMMYARNEKKLTDSDFLSCLNKAKSEVKLPYYFFNSFRVGRRWVSTYDFQYRPPSGRGSSITLDYFQRARWIIELLKGNHNNYLWTLQRSMYQKYLNPAIDSTRHQQNMRHLPNHVPDALYYLFRCFFRGEDDYLKNYIDICKGSPSRIIRDAAALVQEFKDGRTFFGEIDNIHTLKKDFGTNMSW